MSYREIAQLELMNALNSIKSEADLNEFRNLLAHFFLRKKLRKRLMLYGMKEL